MCCEKCNSAIKIHFNNKRGKLFSLKQNTISYTDDKVNKTCVYLPTVMCNLMPLTNLFLMEIFVVCSTIHKWSNVFIPWNPFFTNYLLYLITFLGRHEHEILATRHKTNNNQSWYICISVSSGILWILKVR